MRSKHTLESAKKDFLERGYVLKASEYANNSIRMPAFCTKCQNLFEISLAKLLRGSGCRWCAIRLKADNQRLDVEYIKKYFREQDCELLVDTISSKKPMLYKCKCGRKAKALWDNFKKGKRCGCRRQRGENHYNWNADREQVLLNHQLLKKSCKALQITLNSTGRKKCKKTSELLGYSTRELREHIIAHPNWIKVKNGKWHLDHIFPIKAFLEKGIQDIKLMNSLDNLQPLSAFENLSKRDSYDKIAFGKWLERKNYAAY